MKKGCFKLLPKAEFFNYPETCYPIISVLRTFLLREEERALILSLMANTTTSIKTSAFVSGVVSILQATIDLKQEDIPTIIKIMGIQQVNCFGEFAEKGLSN
jgi:type III secretory pathway component EscS